MIRNPHLDGLTHNFYSSENLTGDAKFYLPKLEHLQEHDPQYFDASRSGLDEVEEILEDNLSSVEVIRQNIDRVLYDLDNGEDLPKPEIIDRLEHAYSEALIIQERVKEYDFDSVDSIIYNNESKESFIEYVEGLKTGLESVADMAKVETTFNVNKPVEPGGASVSQRGCSPEASAD